MTLSDREIALSALDWPDGPLIDNICLYCGIADRKRFSWFCSDECEAGYSHDEQANYIAAVA